MPVQSWGHIQYWETTDTNVAAVVSQRGGYPTWQRSVIIYSSIWWLPWDLIAQGCRSIWWLAGMLWELAGWPARDRAYLKTWIMRLSRYDAKQRLVINRSAAFLDGAGPKHAAAAVGQMDVAAWMAKIATLDGERRAVLERAAVLLQGQTYGAARHGVRQTAVTLGFNQPQAWTMLGNQLREHSDWAENMWRHLNACALADAQLRGQGSTCTNRDRHFAVALAYEGFAANPKGTQIP